MILDASVVILALLFRLPGADGYTRCGGLEKRISGESEVGVYPTYLGLDDLYGVGALLGFLPAQAKLR